MSTCKKCNQKIEPQAGDIWIDDEGSPVIITYDDGWRTVVNPWGFLWGVSPEYTNLTKLLHRPSREGLEGPKDVVS